MSANRPPSPGLQSYADVATYGSLTDASPYDTIKLLLEGALARIAKAKGHMQRGEVGEKAEQLGKALGIVEGLLMSLDTQRGGEIAANLTRLYDYIGRALINANLHDDPAQLDEISALFRELKAGWEGIPVELRG